MSAHRELRGTPPKQAGIIRRRWMRRPRRPSAEVVDNIADSLDERIDHRPAEEGQHREYSQK